MQSRLVPLHCVELEVQEYVHSYFERSNEMFQQFDDVINTCAHYITHSFKLEHSYNYKFQKGDICLHLNTQIKLLLFLSFVQIECSNIIDHAEKIVKANKLDDGKQFGFKISMFIYSRTQKSPKF